MNNMVNDLLLESLLAAGTFQLETRVEDAKLLFTEVCELCEPLALARGLSLECELGEVSALRIDKERVLRVFSNLISNAVKFSPRGATVHVRGEPRNAMALFSVRDHGLGIAPELRDKLFDRYARGKNSPHGLGLGLYIAKSIVRAHGGEIWVESEPNEGAAFFFTLPIAHS
jgi:signal transduction histidine kinase